MSDLGSVNMWTEFGLWKFEYEAEGDIRLTREAFEWMVADRNRLYERLNEDDRK